MKIQDKPSLLSAEDRQLAFWNVVGLATPYVLRQLPAPATTAVRIASWASSFAQLIANYRAIPWDKTTKVEKAAFILPPLFSVCQPFLNDCPKLSLASSSIALWGTLRNAAPKLWDSLKEMTHRPREAIPAALLHSFNIGSQWRIWQNTYEDFQQMMDPAEQLERKRQEILNKIREEDIERAHRLHADCVARFLPDCDAFLQETLAQINAKRNQDTTKNWKFHDGIWTWEDDLYRREFHQRDWTWADGTWTKENGTAPWKETQSGGTKNTSQESNRAKFGPKSPVEQFNAPELFTDNPEHAAYVLDVKIDPACEAAAERLFPNAHRTKQACVETCQRIKTAYRNSSRKVHPDKNPHDKETAQKAFQRLSEFTETLQKQYSCA